MKQRIVLGHLCARAAVHVGSGRSSGLSDAMLRRDVRGRILIPGTAIAGALRTVATRLAPCLELGNQRLCFAIQDRPPDKNEPCGCAVCHLFGDLRPGVNDPEKPPVWFYRDSKPATGSLTCASRLFVYNAVLDDSSGGSLIRDGLGIDRASATSARAGAVKFDREVLPPGARFRLRLELDPSAAEQDEMLLVAALAEWVEGRCRLGARTASGLGRFQLLLPKLLEEVPGVGYRVMDLDSRDGLLDCLNVEDPWSEAVTETDDGTWFEERLEAARSRLKSKRTNCNHIAGSWIEVRMTLRGQGPVLTKDAQLGLVGGTDGAPLSNDLPPLSDLAAWQPQAVLPGASLRGLLRSHCEKILRTLWTAEVGREAQETALLRCPACNPVESRVREDTSCGRPVPLANCDALLRHKGDLSDDAEAGVEHLCLACRLFGSSRRGSRLTVADAPLIVGAGRRWWKVRDFVAIDRFLGGALGGAKFDALALASPCFQFEMELENPQPWELGCLALVVRDLYLGRLQVGWGKSKGFGRIKGEKLGVRWIFLSQQNLPKELQERKVSAKSGLRQVLEFNERDWNANAPLLGRWVKELATVVKDFRRESLPPPEADSYLTEPELISLYGGPHD